MGAFCWHPEARLFGPDGELITPGAGAVAGAVIEDRPATTALVAALSRGGLPFRIGAPDQPAPEQGFETLTSGSTGSPRRIRRPPASWQASFAVNAGLFGIGPGKGVAVLGRLVQSLSLYAALEALHLGADLHVLDRLRPDRQRQALRDRRVSVLWAAPAQIQLLLEAGGPLLPSLQSVLIGGAKLDAATRAGITAICPNAAVREFYGAAEASFITLADDHTPPESVGRAYPGVEICLRDAQGAVQRAGAAEGAVWVRSPYLFDGYGGATGAAVWRDGWLSVGEMGRIEAGHLYLLGRADRMVTVAGQNVYPEAVEDFIATLPGVRRVAVLAQPDRRRGHVLEAVLTGDMAQAEAILAACRARFGALGAPKRLHWRQDWPVLASGKTDRTAIFAQARL